MGFGNGTLRVLTIAIVAWVSGLTLVSSVCAQESEQFVYMEHDKKTGKATFIIYGESAVKTGYILNIKNLVIDVLDDKLTDMSMIKVTRDAKIYPINEKLKNIIEFWAGLKHSRALLTTPRAEYDQLSNSVRGDGEVHLRSESLDIDGVGFEADHMKQTFVVKSKVKVVFRSQESVDAERKTQGLPTRKEKATKKDNAKADKTKGK